MFPKVTEDELPTNLNQNNSKSVQFRSLPLATRRRRKTWKSFTYPVCPCFGRPN